MAVHTADTSYNPLKTGKREEKSERIEALPRTPQKGLAPFDSPGLQRTESFAGSPRGKALGVKTLGSRLLFFSFLLPVEEFEEERDEEKSECCGGDHAAHDADADRVAACGACALADDERHDAEMKVSDVMTMARKRRRAASMAASSRG